MRVMVSVAMKMKAMRRLRQLMAESNVAQPDRVEYGASSVTLFWTSVEKAIMVDISDRGEVGECRLARFHEFPRARA
jgi:hypothetical protein